MEYRFTMAKAKIYINNLKKTLAEIKAETGADVVINGGLYDRNYKPVYHLKADGKVLAQEPNAYWGFGWNNADKALQMVQNYDHLDNYICACALLINGKKPERFGYNPDMGGIRGRTAIGTMPDGKTVIYCSKDGTAGAMTPDKLQKHCMDNGWKDAVMLDGGGSSQCITPEGNITSTRIVQNVLCFWLEKPTEKEADDKMDTVEKAIRQMEDWAADNTHGYDQIYRWNEKGDFDCSAAVIQAWENAGVPVKTKGATYTGNMLNVFLKCGFKDITSKVNLANGNGLMRGDVLLNQKYHTAMYCGNGYEVEASINEKGTATGGTPGDQTGREFLKRTYRNFPWTHILRFTDKMPVSVNTSISTSGRIDTVQEVQLWLNNNFASGLTVDNLYGTQTKKALVKALQKTLGFTGKDVDGIFGKITKSKVKTLSKGSKGTLVMILQAFLVCLGYKQAYVDGDFGDGTDDAVEQLQRRIGLVVDGKAGKNTFTAICK